MLNKLLSLAFLGLMVALTPVGAQTAAPATSKIKGRIVAARVQGQVSAKSKTDGTTRVLHDGDQVTDQTQIVTAPGANVILVFSNGATVNVGSDSTLDIELFEQDPFANDLKVSDLKQEPGTSITRLNLTKGELVGKVVHLNVDRGTEFTVQTPIGAAGIRGTTFKVVFRLGSDGQTHFSLTTSDGFVLFQGVTSVPLGIPAGKQIVSTFDYTPGGSTTPVFTQPTDTPPNEEAQIQAALSEMFGAWVNVDFPPSEGAKENPPSPPAPPPPATTPGAGTAH